MKGVFWILALGALVSAAMAATLTRAANLDASGDIGAASDRTGGAPR